MSERALAHIEEIGSIQPIEGYDRVELATVLGWQVIVQKGEYEVGDRTVYVEIDSILPEKEQFEFLRKRKFRIKTIKMCGVVSQGICFKPELVLENANKYNVGDDVTDIIGITKYEPNPDSQPVERKQTRYYPKFLTRFAWFRKLVYNGRESRGFPHFIFKTDETRIQNFPAVLGMSIPFVVREKVDGQSATYALERKKGKYPWSKDTFDFSVSSRNLRRWKEDDSTYWFIARKYDIENVLEWLIGKEDKFIAIQGEIIAPDVQGNKYHVTEPDFYAFNLIYPSGRVKCQRAESMLERLGIKWCPMVNEAIWLPEKMSEILEYADGESKLYPTLREGLVFRNYETNISFKAVSNKFLLKNDE